MSYLINKTDGTVLTELIDGQIDSESTNLILVGKNYIGYGEAFNENFIRLLENFANTAAPSNPLEGQTWWDKQSQKLLVFDGTQWKTSGSPTVSTSRPQLTAGDIWINSESKQVFVYDGNAENELTLVGPSYTRLQGKSGLEPFSILDTQSILRTVLKLNIGGFLAGVFSSVEFEPLGDNKIDELVTDINPNGIIFEGFNPVDRDNFKFFGTSSGTNSLVSPDGQTSLGITQILPSDRDGITSGTLTVQNSGGITLGLDRNVVQKIVGANFFIENQINNHDLHLRVKSSKFGSTIVDAIRIEAETGRVGIFKTDGPPEYTLDVSGDLRITGNLTVEGDTTVIETSVVRAESKNIFLGDGDVIGDNSVVNDGGLILRSSNNDKKFTWKNLSNSWTSNVNLNVESGNSYMIGGTDILTSTTLASSVTSATGITEIGTLVNLDVDNINIDETAITSNDSLEITAAGILTITASGGIDITAEGDVTLDSQKIRGVAEPELPGDVATKNYVDSNQIIQNVIMSMDVSGLGTGVTLIDNVAAFLNDLSPPDTSSVGKKARIHTVSYNQVSVTGVGVTIRDDTEPDNGETLTVSRISVDSNGTRNESVLQDIEATNPTTGTVSMSPARALLVYDVVDDPQTGQPYWNYNAAESTTYP